MYRKTPKNSDTQNNCCNYPKTGTVSFYYMVIGQKHAVGIANSVDPDQTAPDLGLHCLPWPVRPKT